MLGLSKRLENLNEELSGPVDHLFAGRSHLNELGVKSFRPKGAACKRAPLVDEPFIERVHLTLGNVAEERVFSSASYGDETESLSSKEALKYT